jgi:AraC family transcriptional regulator
MASAWRQQVADNSDVARTVKVPGFALTLGIHSPSSALPRHTHDVPTICYVLRGGFTEYSTGQAAECGAATLKVTPAGEPHSDRFGSDETRGLRIDVDRDRFEDVPAIARVLDERRHLRGGRAGQIARRLAGELAQADPAGSVAAEGLALELLAELARLPSLRADPAGPRWLLQAEELLRERYRAVTSVGALAREVGVNPATLARAYRRRYGRTVGERIRELRVEYAAKVLLTTSEPLSEIALRSGFCDQSHFTNVFRRLLGMTPAAYRAAR